MLEYRTRIFIKLLTESGSAGTLSVTDGLSGVGPPPTLTMSQCSQFGCTPARPAVASAQNATSEDRFVKSSRSFDVGDGKKVRDGKPICRGHRSLVLLDLYLVHRRLQFGRLRTPNQATLKAHRPVAHGLPRGGHWIITGELRPLDVGIGRRFDMGPRRHIEDVNLIDKYLDPAAFRYNAHPYQVRTHRPEGACLLWRNMVRSWRDAWCCAADRTSVRDHRAICWSGRQIEVQASHGRLAFLRIASRRVPGSVARTYNTNRLLRQYFPRRDISNSVHSSGPD